MRDFLTDYRQFIKARSDRSSGFGFDPIFMPSFLYPFQEHLCEWAINQGRSAIFADCGLGKTPMQLVWAENVVRHTNGRVLILTPLAVSAQTVREADKFGIECHRPPNGKPKPGINITNYERLHYFDPSDFDGVVCDESSILKSFTGVRRKEITQFMRGMDYRLLCTATAAPNDFTELGTSSEALGYLGHMDMLNRFFKNDKNNSATGRAYGKATEWRFKGHAEDPFWRWVASWARALRRPSDLGFDDDGFILPPLNEMEHIVEASILGDGMLFDLPAVGLDEQRDEQRRTLDDRCQSVAGLVDGDQPALIWCQLNAEGDRLAEIIPDAVQISGSDRDEAKEEKFIGFANGDIKKLITKPKIGAWGLNFQHCNIVTTFPSHSFEQYYQSVRRCWRYGQVREVNSHVVTTEGGKGVMANLRRKADACDKMFDRLVSNMGSSITIDRQKEFTEKEEIPSWL